MIVSTLSICKTFKIYIKSVRKTYGSFCNTCRTLHEVKNKLKSSWVNSENKDCLLKTAVNFPLTLSGMLAISINQ